MYVIQAGERGDVEDLHAHYIYNMYMTLPSPPLSLESLLPPPTKPSWDLGPNKVDIRCHVLDQ